MGRRVKVSRCTRRAALTGSLGASLSLAISSLWDRGAGALGRIPVGGTIQTALPWPVDHVDPHALDDPLAAFLGHALFDPLYAQTPTGAVFPTLANALPESTAEGVVVQLRPGLKTGRGRKLTGKDLQWSINRARALGAHALLHPFGPAKQHPRRADAVVFERGTAEDIARALTSPLGALLPRAFDANNPDGTGRFSARRVASGLTLTRNLNAARGPAFLEQVQIEGTADIADALRRFESGQVNVGWLGRGLHHARAGSRLIRAPSVGWVVLHAGKAAGEWSTPGAAQLLLDGIDESQLQRFGLDLPPRRARRAAYTGPPGELLTRADCPYLVELGTALAELLSSPGHVLTLRAVSADQLKQYRRASDYCLALDILRELGNDARSRQLSLLSGVKRALSHHPSVVAGAQASLATDTHTTRALPMGIVGGLRVVVASVDRWARLEHWDLGRVYLEREA